MARGSADPAQIFRALGDPVRLSIVRQIAGADELTYGTLERTLPVSKPTISHHTKILRRAGVIDVRRRGRTFCHTIRGETLGGLAHELRALGPGPRPAGGADRRYRTERTRPPGVEPVPRNPAPGNHAAPTAPPPIR